MNGDKREFYAESVPEAVAKASNSLGVPPEQLQYVVLDEGSSGFLGIGARDARITVAVPELPVVSPSGTDSISSELSGNDLVVPKEAEPLQRTDVPDYSAVVEETTAEEEGESSSSREAAPEDLIIAVDGFAIELLQNMGFDATVDAYDAGEVIKVDISTGETGLLIGQKGETIDAVERIINLVIYKNRPFLKRITVDTEGYRQRRVEALQGMAHRTARRAQREKRPVDLPPMAASERRVVHLFLEGNPNVSTSSEGEEEDRRVVITPNK